MTELLEKIHPGDVGTLAAIFSALVAFWRFIKPILDDKRNQAAFVEVSRLAIMGASAAVKAYFDAIGAARASTSASGAMITPEEQKAALQVGISTAWALLVAQGPAAVQKIVGYYGGEDAVKAAIEVIIRRKAFGERIDEHLSTAP